MLNPYGEPVTGILYLIYLIAYEPLWHTHEHAVG